MLAHFPDPSWKKTNKIKIPSTRTYVKNKIQNKMATFKYIYISGEKK